MYISWGKIVPIAEAIKAMTMSVTPTLTEEKKFHILSMIVFLYVCERLALPSYLISISWFSFSLPSTIPHFPHIFVPNGFT
jgi:hypothetical protein